MKIKFLCALVGLLCVLALCFDADSQTARARRQKRAPVCFDPNAACKSAATFQAWDLPFRVPANAVIWESEPFYAVILQSVRFTDQECETKFIPEAQRLEAQALFPNRKVFASRCSEPGTVFYSNINPNSNFMAVYGGQTQAEAARMLASVKATGKFPGAYLRRISAGFNGT